MTQFEILQEQEDMFEQDLEREKEVFNNLEEIDCEQNQLLTLLISSRAEMGRDEKLIKI